MRVHEKANYRIGEAAKLIGVEPSVLRFWEREFEQLQPTKSSTNQRIYSRQDVILLKHIKRLLHDERYTIEGAKRRLIECYRAQLELPLSQEDYIGYLKAIRAELVRIREAVSELEGGDELLPRQVSRSQRRNR